MLETEKQKLLAKEKEYIGIGITEGGVPRESIGVPWERTVHAFNMRTPSLYIAPEDLENSQIMALLAEYKVIGCYIWAPLNDYHFLSSFPEIGDLNIKCGDRIRDLDFLKGLTECNMLYLENARLKNLDVLLDMKKNNRFNSRQFSCVGLCNCEVEDLSRFATERFSFSEFLIWNPVSRDEKEKWKVVSANTRKYYEFNDSK